MDKKRNRCKRRKAPESPAQIIDPEKQYHGEIEQAWRGIRSECRLLAGCVPSGAAEACRNEQRSEEINHRATLTPADQEVKRERA